MPALTAEARTRPAARGTGGLGPFNTIDDFSLWDRCITRGLAGSWLPVVYGNGTRIMQTPDSVIIAHEMVHEARVIPLDGRPHVGGGLRQLMGDSRGHWEGNTLVIETTNFTDRIAAAGGGVRYSEAMKIDGADHPDRSADGRVRDARRGPEDLCRAVDAPDDPDQPARLRDRTSTAVTRATAPCRTR